MSYDFIIKAPVEQHNPFEYNVTYNLRPMLQRAGFHPAVVAGMNVAKLRPIVTEALTVMVDNENYFKLLNPTNGYRDYLMAVKFLRDLHRYVTNAPEGYVMMVV